MSDSSLTSAVVAATQAVQDLTRQEQPAAAITLTRSATLAITTAGTVITWQTQTRGQGITWATTDITIPTAGYYLIQSSYATTTNVILSTQLYINGTRVGAIGFSEAAQGFHHATYMRHFSTSDVIQIWSYPAANATIAVNAENVLNFSPWLNVVQLTSVVT